MGLKHSWLGYVLCAAALFSAGPVATAATPYGLWIPVIVNRYKDANITDAQVRDALNEANKILNSASNNLNINLVLVQEPNDTSEEDGDNDGSFDDVERSAMRTYGGKEIQKLPNKRGIKLSFGKTPVEGGSAVGVALSGTDVPGDPTIILKKTTIADTGQTIAHELGHVFGIAGDYNNPDRVMDYLGRGTKFSEDEKKQMRKYNIWKNFAKCSSQWSKAYPANKLKQHFGAVTDAAGDVAGAGASGMHDLSRTTLSGIDPADQSGFDVQNVLGQITLNGVADAGAPFLANYAVGFDADADPLTGEQFAGLAGVDRIGFFTVSGNGPDNLAATGGMYDVLAQAWTPLVDAAEVCAQEEIHDYDQGGELFMTSLDFALPTSLLGLVGDEVPTVTAAGIGFDELDPLASFEAFDTSEMLYDRLRWQKDATLLTFGDGVPTPGLPYRFDVFGLEPDSPFTLYLDGDEVFSGMTDSNGDHVGNSFLFPGNLSVESIHQLTAQDDTGEFAYAITCPEPASLGILGLAGLAMLRRRRAG